MGRLSALSEGKDGTLFGTWSESTATDAAPGTSGKFRLSLNAKGNAFLGERFDSTGKQVGQWHGHRLEATGPPNSPPPIGLRWLCEAYVGRARCRLAKTTRCVDGNTPETTATSPPVPADCEAPISRLDSATAAEEARQLELAAADVARAIALWPRDAVAWSVLAEVREKQGLLSLAIDAYEELLFLQPPAPQLARRDESSANRQGGVVAALACARALEDEELAVAVRARQGRLAELREQLESQWSEILED